MTMTHEALAESFKALVRSLEREYRSLIIGEQSKFRSKMFDIRAVNTTQFPQGLANIAEEFSFEFVRKAAKESESLQDLSDSATFDEACQLLFESGTRLLTSGKEGNCFVPALNWQAGATRMFAHRKLQDEVRDVLLIAKGKRETKGSHVEASPILVPADPLGKPAKRERASNAPQTHWKQLLAAAFILILSLVGFYLLPWTGGILWLFFLIVAFPIVLAFTVSKPLTNRSLLELYKRGLTAIPVLGQLLSEVAPIFWTGG